MGNCLITKLKDPVINSDLVHIGELRFSVGDTDVTDERYVDYLPHNIGVENGIITGSWEDSNHLSKNSVGFFAPCYDIKRILTADAQSQVYMESDFSAFRYLDNLYYVHIKSNNYIDPLAYKNVKSNVTNLALRGDIKGNIESLKDFTGIETLIIIGPTMTGNIATGLGKMTNLCYLNIGTLTRLSGTVEDLVKEQVRNGRTSGSIGSNDVEANISIPVYADQPLSRLKYVQFGSQYPNGYNIVLK